MIKNNELVGTWGTDSTDLAAMQSYGLVIMEFSETGELAHRIQTEDGSEQIMFLTYRVEGDKLISNQPSFQRKRLPSLV